MFRLLLTAFALLYSAHALAERPPALFILDTEINTDTLMRYRRATFGSDVVYIAIDSPGGEINSARAIALDMERNHREVVCYIRSAASAALEIIMPACSKRIVTPETRLKFHTGHVSFGPEQPMISSDELYSMAKDLAEENERIVDAMILSMRGLGISPANIRRHFREETYFLAADADTVIDPHFSHWFTMVLVGDAENCLPMNPFSMDVCPTSPLEGVIKNEQQNKSIGAPRHGQ